MGTTWIASNWLWEKPILRFALHILRRMERFMTCYPPYWYHVARTQQGLGQLAGAAATYEKLRELGHGHFRKDDMLAAALANRAAIQAFCENPSTETGQRALEYSNTCWQAILVCARILAQNQAYSQAEDAVLRNLDVALEQPQSLACLLSLYCETKDRQKLTARLNDAETLALVPDSTRSCCNVRPRWVRTSPAPAMHQIVCSLYGYEQPGREQLSFELCSPTGSWKPRLLLSRREGVEYASRTTQSQQGQTVLQFSSNDQHLQQNENNAGEILLDLNYEDGKPIRLHFTRMSWTPEMQLILNKLPGVIPSVVL